MKYKYQTMPARLTLLILSIGVSLLYGQNEEPIPAQLDFFAEPILEGTYLEMDVPKKVTLTLVWLSLDPEDPDEPFEFQTIELPFGQLTRGPEVVAGGEVSLYLGEIQSVDDKQPFERLQIPATANHALCYLIPIGPDRFRPSLHDVSRDFIPRGRARLVNASSETLAAVIDETRGIIPPGENLSAALGQLHQFQIKMRIVAEDDGEWRPIHAARVTAQASDRLLVIISRRRGDIGPWRVRPIHLR